MRMQVSSAKMRLIRVAPLAALSFFVGTGLHAQSAPAAEEIPLERCDRLPVVRVLIGKAELRFLVDTGATTMLNLKSFAKGQVKQIEVTSWSGDERARSVCSGSSHWQTPLARFETS